MPPKLAPPEGQQRRRSGGQPMPTIMPRVIQQVEFTEQPGGFLVLVALVNGAEVGVDRILGFGAHPPVDDSRQLLFECSWVYQCA